MKSKLLVLAVLSTLSMAASADTIDLWGVDFDLEDLAPRGVDISVVNTSINRGDLDTSIEIEADGDISVSQANFVKAEAEVEVEVEVESDVAEGKTDTITTTAALVENIGNKFSTNGIGAYVNADTTINTAMNTESSSGDFEVEFEADMGHHDDLEFSLDLERSSRVATAPDIFVANTAINTADLDSSFEMETDSAFFGSNDIELENLTIATNAIGAAVVSTTTLNVGISSHQH